MARIVLRIRLIAGDRLDVTYEDSEVDDADELAEKAIAAPAGLRPSPTRHVTSVLVRWQTSVAGQRR